MTTIIVCIVLFFGGFSGGMVTMGIIQANQPPKTEITEIKATTTVTTTVPTSVLTWQGQITIVDSKTNININISDFTNMIKSMITNTNYNSCVTNKR